MFEKDIVVTDQEVEAFLEKNKASIPANSDMQKLQVAVREQLKAQKIDQKGNELIKKLKQEAKIYTFVSY